MSISNYVYFIFNSWWPTFTFFYLSLILWKHEYIIFNIFLSIIIIFVNVYFTHDNAIVEKHEILGYDVHLFLNKNAPIARKDCWIYISFYQFQRHNWIDQYIGSCFFLSLLINLSFFAVHLMLKHNHYRFIIILEL